MSFADVVFRQGHLSEKALVAVIMTGERPLHLDRCERCAARAVDLGRWLDHVRTEASDAADAAFPVERLAAQQAQILRRLEQADEPARVIAFPAATRSTQRAQGMRVAPAWLGVAAAAGLVVGVVGSQFTARMSPVAPMMAPAAAGPANVQVAPENAADTMPGDDGRFFHRDLERATPGTLEGMDQHTPRLVSQLTVASLR